MRDVIDRAAAAVDRAVGHVYGRTRSHGHVPILFLLNVVIVYSMGVAVDTLVDAKRSR